MQGLLACKCVQLGEEAQRASELMQPACILGNTRPRASAFLASVYFREHAPACYRFPGQRAF